MITSSIPNASSVPNGPSSANATANNPSTNVAEMIANQLSELKNKFDSKRKVNKTTNSNESRSKSKTNKTPMIMKQIKNLILISMIFNYHHVSNEDYN
jgi:ABC-type Na+ efflux pump permease subunit